MWTIYKHPLDYPDAWVARRLIVRAGQIWMTYDMFTADTLDEVRALLPQGLDRIDRSPNDDPVIAEVWI
jgi:hypothetical protein